MSGQSTKITQRGIKTQPGDNKRNNYNSGIVWNSFTATRNETMNSPAKILKADNFNLELECIWTTQLCSLSKHQSQSE